MYLLDEAFYRETKNIALNLSDKSELVYALSDWFKQTYSIEVINVQFGPLSPSRERYRLYVIIGNQDDYRKSLHGPFQYNEDLVAQVSSEFRRLALKYRYADESQLKNLLVLFNDFSQEAKTEANLRAIEDAKRRIMSKHPSVWDVVAISFSSIVFYYLQWEVIENENNGISKAIADDYYHTLKKYDDLNYFTRENLVLKFDSKENLDNNFQGSFFNYSR